MQVASVILGNVTSLTPGKSALTYQFHTECNQSELIKIANIDQRDRDIQTERQRDRDRETERQRQTDRQTDK